MNIPIYRAKKIDSDEWVEGNLNKNVMTSSFYIASTDVNNNGYIDTNTLAIHFPNMIDKNGKKIFASLSEDGVGGDIIVNGLSTTYYPRPLFFTSSGMFINSTHPLNRIKDFSIYEVIGIHKGEINENATP